MSVSIDDRAFLASLPDAFAGLVLDAKAIQHDRADRISDTAKQYVHVHSGETRDSIEVTVVEDGDVEVGSRLEKATYENYGTSKMAGTHFMTAAIAQNSS